jgi:phosphate transport system permease protein
LTKSWRFPYHIYVLATAGTEIEATRPLQYGTALVLIVLVLGPEPYCHHLPVAAQKEAMKDLN